MFPLIVLLLENNLSLSTEEYENIWLRIKDKISKLFAGYVLVCTSLIMVMGVFGLNVYVGNKIEEEVEKMVSSETLSQQITKSISEQIESIDSQLNSTKIEIEELENSARKLSEFSKGFPFEVKGNRLTITTSVGNIFVVEKGHCVSVGKVIFSDSFNEPPSVFIADCPSGVKPSNIVVVDVTNEGFRLYSRGIMDSVRKMSWIAVSK